MSVRCRGCINVNNKRNWYKNHRKHLVQKKFYRLSNKDKLNSRARERYWNNLEKMRGKGRESQRRSYEKNKVSLIERSKLYGKKNREKILIRERKWAINNIEKYRAKNRRGNKKRKLLIKIDGRVRLSTRISDLIRRRLKARLGSKNKKHRKDYLPYDINELMRHLEKLFQPDMTWQNYGKWHIDHKRPDSSFIYKSTKDPGFKESWALTNLQPLWAGDNLRKGKKII